MPASGPGRRWVLLAFDLDDAHPHAPKPELGFEQSVGTRFVGAADFEIVWPSDPRRYGLDLHLETGVKRALGA